MNKYLISVFLLALSLGVRAQSDSTRSAKLRWNVTGGAFFQQVFSGGTPKFKAPDYLQVRRPVEPELANRWGLRNNNDVTDNPLGHGPMYIRPHMWYAPIPELEFYTSLTIDHRGASWGPYNTDNITFIPRFHARYDSWRKLKSGDSLRVFGKMGYFEDYRGYEGLTLYNIDLQGLSAGIQYGHFQAAACRMGDLIRGYGLGIDGVNDYQLGFIDLQGVGRWKVDLKTGLQKMIGYPATGGDQRIYSLSAALHDRNTRIYVEGGYRQTDFNPGLNMAWVTGYADEVQRGKWNVKWKLEYRYYGGGFNYQFRNEGATHFRDVNRPLGSNFIGDAVYPVSFYGRPFSQWAVFTEYDKQWVQGVSWYGTLSRELKKNFSLFSDFDVNGIIAKDEDPFLYPFYNAGMKLTAMKDTCLSLSMTNRTMNLDKHYTTYYLLVKPVFQFELKRTI